MTTAFNAVGISGTPAVMGSCGLGLSSSWPPPVYRGPVGGGLIDRLPRPLANAADVYGNTHVCLIAFVVFAAANADLVRWEIIFRSCSATAAKMWTVIGSTG